MKIPIELNLNAEDNKRRSYRVSVHETVDMTIGGKSFKVLDISTTGLAFETDSHIEGEINDVIICFSIDKKYRLKPKLRMSFCKEGRCGAEFINLSERASRVLSQLVIYLQKIQIRNDKKLQDIDE